MKKWMRTACLALTGLAMAVSLTGCNPKVKDKVVDDSTSTVGGIETQTHIITDTFSIPIPSSCRGVEDKLNTDLYTWVPTPEGEHIPKDTDFVRVEVAALDDGDAASKGFEEHGFEDATDSNLHYHYENGERSKIGGYILISADQYITTDDGETEDEPRKTINFVVSDGNGSGRAFYVIIRGFTQEYRDAVMDEIKLVNE